MACNMHVVARHWANGPSNLISKADLSSTPSRRPQPPTSELWMPLPPPTSAVLPANGKPARPPHQSSGCLRRMLLRSALGSSASRTTELTALFTLLYSCDADGQFVADSPLVKRILPSSKKECKSHFSFSESKQF